MKKIEVKNQGLVMGKPKPKGAKAAIYILILVALGLAVALVFFKLAPKTKFTIVGLSVNPTQTVVGENVQLEIRIKNEGGKGVFPLSVYLDGQEYARKDIEMEAGQERTVTLTLSATKGTHSVRVDSRECSFRICEPARFEVTGIEIPDTVSPAQEIVCRVYVKNLGEMGGEYRAVLMVDNIISREENVWIDAGATRELRFNFTAGATGKHTVSIENVVRTFEAIPGAVPVWQGGERWIYQYVRQTGVTQWTLENLESVKREGQDFYHLKISIEPPENFGTGDLWIQKNFALIELELRGENLSERSVSSFSSPIFPLQVGKELGISEDVSRSGGETERRTFTLKVEGFENVTVPAGTLPCFKISEYEHGNLVSIWWYNEGIGFLVKQMSRVGTLSLLGYEKR
jgi:hypothetical protein